MWAISFMLWLIKINKPFGSKNCLIFVLFLAFFYAILWDIVRKIISLFCTTSVLKAFLELIECKSLIKDWNSQTSLLIPNQGSETYHQGNRFPEWVAAEHRPLRVQLGSQMKKMNAPTCKCMYNLPNFYVCFTILIWIEMLNLTGKMHSFGSVGTWPAIYLW